MRWWAQAQDHSCRCFQPITTPTSLCVFLRAHLCGWGCFHGGSLRNHCAYGRGHAFKCTLCSMHHIWCWEAALMNHRSSEFLCVYHVCLYVFVHVSERATCKQIAWALMIQTSFPAHILFAWLILLCRTFLMHNVLAHWEGALEASPGPLTPSPKCLVGPFLPVHNPSAMQNSESNLLASFFIIPFVRGPWRVWVLDFGLWIGFGIFWFGFRIMEFGTGAEATWQSTFCTRRTRVGDLSLHVGPSSKQTLDFIWFHPFNFRHPVSARSARTYAKLENADVSFGVWLGHLGFSWSPRTATCLAESLWWGSARKWWQLCD